MCGIAGYISAAGNVDPIVLKKQTDVIAHRGPDGEGQWVDGSGKAGLGHRRLSIIDLSDAGAQPMHYLDRYSIVFNGEIYNYIELREQCLAKGYRFRSETDTEVLMALYDWKGEACLELLDGMFSFALYDAKEQTLFCARDRFGEKPFFYTYEPGARFIFGSEMKCLWAAGVTKKVNDRMLFNYLNFGYLDNPRDVSETFYERCVRLPHAHSLTLDVQNCTIRNIRKYYSINWQQQSAPMDAPHAVERFRELMFESVKRRLRSDVPVGSSLSGGLDSSVVVCIIDILKKNTDQKQNTFSAVFPGFEKDERKYMDYVIARTNVSPHFVTPDKDGLIHDLEKLSYHQEEPFGSASIYAQYCVMRLAKENNVTVLLDGQGADEIMAGYPGYYSTYFKELKRSSRKNYRSQLAAFEGLHANAQSLYNAGSLRHAISPVFIKALRKLKHAVKSPHNELLHPDFLAAHRNSSYVFNDGYGSLNEELYQHTLGNGALQQLLRYADRNSMAHSREVRLPFLNHELVDFLFSLSPELKINQGWSKWIMREGFRVELPEEIGWRKDKVGFEPPQRSWMDKDDVKEKVAFARQQLGDKQIIDKKKIGTGAVQDDNKINWRYLQTLYLFR